LVRRLRELGFEGPFPGGRHEAMRHLFSGVKVPIPNPHTKEIDWLLTERILQQAGISRHQWEQAGR
jgi:hypothetical protein